MSDGVACIATSRIVLCVYKFLSLLFVVLFLCYLSLNKEGIQMVVLK
jgi:hypothetical protein